MKINFSAICLLLVCFFINCSSLEHSGGNGIGGTGKKSIKSPDKNSIDIDINLIAITISGKNNKQKEYFHRSNEYGLRVQNNFKSKIQAIINVFEVLNN